MVLWKYFSNENTRRIYTPAIAVIFLSLALIPFVGSAEAYTLTINSVDMADTPFPGFFTTIHDSGTLVQTGFTPMTFAGMDGTTYTVETQDYLPWLFVNWEDGSQVAVRDITLNSDNTITASYIDSTGDVTAPIVLASPTGGTYISSVDVTLSATDDIDPTPAIYYTIDGSTPTISSTIYTGLITITFGTTLNFIAVDAAGNVSPLSTEVYVITPDVTPSVVSAYPTSGIFINSVYVMLSATDNIDPAPTFTNISTCQTLDIPGETYILTSDITTTENCFIITADGITLDGNGHKIIGDASGIFADQSGDYGVYIISSTGVTVQNIDISYFIHGIQIESSNGNTVKNSYIHQINKYGVQFDGSGGSSNNLVYNNYFYQSENGVHALPSDSNYNIVTLNTFHDSIHEQVHWHATNCINLAYNNNFIDAPDWGFHDECPGGDNQFFTIEDGGNWYNHYDEPSEGCFDSNSDGFCDDPFFGEGNQDDLPFTKQNGWASGTIYYTTDGSTPTTSSTIYTGLITITADTTLGFIAADAAGNTSPVSTEVYDITFAYTLTINSVNMAGTAFPGFFTTIHEGGTLVQTGFTPMTFAGTPGTTYTVETQDYLPWLFGNWEDGSTVAVRDVTLNSDNIITASFIDSTSDVIPPVVSANPTGGTYAGSVDVTLSATDNFDPTPTIYYTMDGSTPTTASPVYTAPITITSDTTLGFIATDSFGNTSPVSTESYVITTSPIVTLTINSVNMAGTSFPGFFTTIHEGGTLVQTGFTPMTFAGTPGTTYTVETQDYLPWLFGNWEDGSTVAVRDVTLNSDNIITASFIDSTSDVIPPVVSANPTGGTYAGSVDVTLSATDNFDPTPTIYYTMDGSTPTTSSPVYIGPITITFPTTLSFVAADTLGNTSPVSAENYIITPQTTTEITIITVDGTGVEITGYWTVISQGGTPLQTGFSPLTFTVNLIETYEVMVSDWAGITFDHWDDGSTVNPRTFSITSDTTLTASYLP